MKLTKALAMFVALVMVFFCLSAPAVFSADEHPWDQEGGGDNGLGGAGTDSTGTIVRPAITDGINPPAKEGLNRIDFFLVIIKYGIQSGYMTVSQKVYSKGVDKRDKNKMTCVNSR